MTIKNLDLVIYQAPNGAIELRGDVNHETIWANLDQIAQVFGRDKSVISRHIKNIFKDEELDKKVVVAKNATTSPHGAIKNKTQTQEVNFYNLDMIISVGYRVNSVVATQFRKRATQTLKQHITQWYTINPERIKHNYDQFLKTVEEIKSLTLPTTSLQANDILELISSFSGTWFSLDAYDRSSLELNNYTTETIQLEAQKLYDDISLLKQDLIKKWEASDLFAQEKYTWSLEWIFGNIFQTAFGEEVYPSTESKAAHLLYFIIKNHPFNDGNKRTWAFAFIRLLRKSSYPFESKITPQALTALALLIAESDPHDKDKIVWLTMLLLTQ